MGGGRTVNTCDRLSPLHRLKDDKRHFYPNASRAAAFKAFSRSALASKTTYSMLRSQVPSTAAFTPTCDNARIFLARGEGELMVPVHGPEVLQPCTLQDLTFLRRV